MSESKEHTTSAMSGDKVTVQIKRNARYFLSLGSDEYVPRIPVYSGRQVRDLLSDEGVDVTSYRLRKAIHSIKDGSECEPLAEGVSLYSMQNLLPQLKALKEKAEKINELIDKKNEA